MNFKEKKTICLKNDALLNTISLIIDLTYCHKFTRCLTHCGPNCIEHMTFCYKSSLGILIELSLKVENILKKVKIDIWER